MRYEAPGATFTSSVVAATGLTGTIGVRIIGDGATVTPRTTSDITEYPTGSGVYTAELTAPDDVGEYQILWDDGTVSQRHISVQDLVVTVGARVTVGRSGGAYATTAELALLLRVNESDREDALQRVLDAAADEIDAELGLTTPYVDAPALVAQVNLERAVEHWKQQQSPFGLIGLPGEGVPAFASSDSWNRHAQKLAPLKETWGVA